MVELRGVSYRVGHASIIERVSAAFRDGRFNVILGPNGAGKSSLLRIATGLRTPSAGEVLYDGRPVSALRPDELARLRAVLSQHVELAFPLPVQDVVLMGRYPHFRRAPAARDRRIVADALELVGLSHKREQAYVTLSGGEQQKVHLARVLAQIWDDDGVPARRYLFLDEPTTNLDLHYQIHLLDVARGLLDRGCTVIAIIHDPNVALQYGDSFFFLAEGRLVLAADRAADITGELLERVFRVRAYGVADPERGDTFWRFGL